jgi:hypothetical protein
VTPHRFAFLALLSAFLALPTLAADSIIGSSPKVDVYLGPLVNYADQFDPGFALTIVPRAKPFLFTLDASKMRIDGTTGETPFRVGCRDFLVPYSVDGRTTSRVAFAFQFKLSSWRARK